MNKILVTFTTIAFLILFAGAPAQAELVSFEFDFDPQNLIDPFNVGNTDTNNDCAGYFGGDFNDCMISYGETDISPIIIKFTPGEAAKINPEFDSITGLEWDISGETDLSSGIWTYTPGEDDPEARFWAAKAGAGFNLFWDVDQIDLDAGLCDTINSLECLLAANSVTSGTWQTPGDKALSHLTFYDSAPSPIPVPAAFWLFGTALIGFIGISRRIKV